MTSANDNPLVSSGVGIRKDKSKVVKKDGEIDIID